MRRVAYRRYPRLRHARRRFIWVVLLLAALPQLADATNGFAKADSPCAVWRIIDGDTISMRCGASFTSLRLADIDTPELDAACFGELWRAWAAKQRLRWAFLSARTIALPSDGPTDRYGRRLGAALVDGRPAAEQLIDAGLAVPYIPGDIPWCDRIERGRA